MIDLLPAWCGPNARATLLGRYPEIALVADATAALLKAQDAGVLDRASLVRAASVATGFRKGVGYIQESDPGLPLDVRCALNLVKRGVRDASFVLPWPPNPDGAGMVVKLTQEANDALDRLENYDPFAGTATYLGVMQNDLRALATGIAIEVAR